MTQRFFINPSGDYLGSYDGPNEEMPDLFNDTTEVPTCPEDSRQHWNGTNWDPLPPQSYDLAVEDIWARMTDTEAEAFDAAMTTAVPLKMRRQFLVATSILSTSDLFTFTVKMLKTVVSINRANAITAP